MPALIDFYTIGFVIALMLSAYRLQEDGKLTFSDIIFSIIIGAFSWIGVLALLVGSRLKKLGEHYKNNS